MTELYKQHELTIDINPNERIAPTATNTNFFSMDIKTGKLIINFRLHNQTLDLTSANVLIGFHFVNTDSSKVIESKDGSVIIEDATRGRCAAILPNHLFAYSGRVYIHVYILFEDGRSFDCATLTTYFRESWLDQELPAMEEFYVRRFEELARKIRERSEEMERTVEEAKRELQESLFQFKVDAKGQLQDLKIEIKDKFSDFTNDLKSKLILLYNDFRDRLERLRTDVDAIEAQIVKGDLVSRPEFHDHARNDDIHITIPERNRWNATGLDLHLLADQFDIHVSNEDIHSGGVGSNDHTHTISQVDSLQTKLDGLSNHTHQINGSTFNGTDIIDTIRWGVARSITIGNATRNVNGERDEEWTLTSIGAAATNHTHTIANVTNLQTELNNRLRLSGGTLTGDLIGRRIRSGDLELNGASTLRNMNGNLWLEATNGTVRSETVLNETTTTGSNINISTGVAQIRRVSSAERYKININRGVDIAYAEKLLEVEPATWFDRNNTEAFSTLLTRQFSGEKVDLNEAGIEMVERIGGLVAEDVEKAGLDIYVSYSGDGKTVEGVAYERLWTLLIPLVRHQRDQLTALEARLEKLEREVRKII